MSDAAIEVRHLRKTYDATCVVDDVSFTVEDEIFGLLGPNGAGKSTVLNIILGLTKPDSGSVSALGKNLMRIHAEARSLIGYLPQQDALYEDLSLKQNLEFFARINSVSSTRLRKFSSSTLHSLGLSKHLSKRPDELSGGMRRRASLACAMIHDPPILILDEPTSGLDPMTRHMLWRIFRDLRRAGKAILFSTHYMDEAEALCNRVGIMSAGRLAAVGQPGQLKQQYLGGLDMVELDVASVSADLLSELFALGDQGVRLVERSETKIKFMIDDPISSRRVIEPVIRKFGLSMDSARYKSASLEDVFMRVVGQRMSSDDPSVLEHPSHVVVKRGTIVYADFSKRRLLSAAAVSNDPQLKLLNQNGGVRRIQMPYPNRGNMCPRCGYVNRPGVIYCTRDRTMLPPTFISRAKSSIAFCTNCGTANHYGAQFCKHCRAKFRSAQNRT